MEPADIASRAGRLPNVEYRGEYRSPVDLPGLYGDVDLVWACYPGPEVVDPDERWALRVCRSNRFYESCYFARPLISLAGSGDGDEVERHEIGLVINDQEPSAVCAALAAISNQDLARWGANLARLPRSVFLYTSEQETLRNAVERLAREDEPLET
jgi:succinoglycan biosynthesis protein ExoL